MRWFLATVEHQKILALLNLKRLLFEISGTPPSEKPAAKEIIGGLPAPLVIIMGGVKLPGFDPVRGIVELVDLLYGRIFQFRGIDSPIAGCRHQQKRSWGHGRSNFHVVYMQAQMALILTIASALHVGRYHVDHNGGPDSIVDRPEQESLRPPARGSGAANAFAIHFFQRREKIYYSDTVPQLQAQDPNAPQILPLPAEAAVLDLIAILVPCHVVGKYDMALARQIDAAPGDRT